jgi:MYXO-CTERM domain-containing protein
MMTHRLLPRRRATLLVPLAGLLLAAPAAAKNLTSADGPGDTYALLQRNFTTELPDCGHMVPHITEEMDSELKKNVFIFHIHVNQDDDRCGAQDRQRVEIRAKAGDIVAQNGETVWYRWKFKLPAGFQTASSFTHIMQIKSDQAAPVMTLTPRNNTLAIDGRVGVRGTTDLAKFVGNWVVAEMKILFGNAGRIELTIRKIAGGDVLFNYAGAADTWDDNSSGHDFKCGIYRSLNNRGDLRDEQVRYADLCASKTSAADCDDGTLPPGPPPPPDPTPTSDAGATRADGGSAPDAGGARADTGTSPPSTSDAAGGGTRPADASSGTGTPPPYPPPSPPPTEPDPTPTTPPKPRKSSGGCSYGGAPSGGAAVLLLACAVGLIRRRRR